MASFSSQVKSFGITTINRHALFVRKVAIDITSSVILKTPVDTGRARGNWQVQINSPITSTLDVNDKTGATTIGTATNTLANYKAGDIYITNNLPYIIKLEQGSSKQQPAGMVAITIREFDRIISKNK